MSLFTRRALLAAVATPPPPQVAVILSANAEWREVRKHFPHIAYQRGPYGEYFFDNLDGQRTLIAQGGWGKVSAAASAQWIVSNFNPSGILNIGTCGGVEGRIKRFANILATRTLIYDIKEAMGDPDEAVRHYTVDLDTSWASNPPLPVARLPLLSADRDLVPADVESLVQHYGVSVVDWESGAIAWVASRNQKRVAILRGVSDLVNPTGGQAYGNESAFIEGTAVVMRPLLDTLPEWVRLFTPSRGTSGGAGRRK